MDNQIEYVARVVVERIECRVVPKGTATRPRLHRDSEDRLVREKYELTSFTIRADSLDETRDRVTQMMGAALPSPDVMGERKQTRTIKPVDDEEDEEEEGF